MSSVLFRGGKIITATGISDGEVLTKDGVICEVSLGGKVSGEAEQVTNLEGKYLSPGFIDIHTHGAGGADFMDRTAGSMEQACKMHLKHGTTSIVPTTLTSTKEDLLDFLRFFNTVELKRDAMPEILGLHLEGPYFAESQKGAQDPKYLRNPDPEEYMEALSCTDRIIRWSFAVELPGADEFLIALREHHIISSLAHSDADCSQVMSAYENGISALTHFYSCMTGVVRKNAYRVAGAIEAGYLLDDLYVEAIADGCHLPDHLLSLIYKIKGADRICLVTDSMRAAGLPDGEYLLGSLDGGQKCIVEDGVAKLPDRSAFAGSVATMDRLVRTFRKLTEAPLYEVVKMASLTPAKLLGIADRKGSIAIGKDADLLVFDENIQIETIMVRGTLVS
ncbi:MAG: N-acetylglucosamine-6-phosphate deacetylase [Clostridium sp.]